MNRSWITSGLVLIPGTLWGMSFILVDIILLEMPPYSLTALRSFISSLGLAGILYAVGGRLPTTLQGWRPYFWLGVFNNALPFTLLTLGQTLVPSGLATILTSAMPLFTIVLAHFYTEEKLTVLKVLGVLVGFGGVAVLFLPSLLAAENAVSISLTGMTYIIAAAFCYAVGNIMIKGFFERARETPPETGNSGLPFLLEVSATQFAVTAVILAPISVWVDRPWELSLGGETWAAMMTLALAITVIAGVVYFYLIENAGPSVAATSVYIIPISGVLGSAAFLGQAITFQAVIALLFIFAGIGLVSR